MATTLRTTTSQLHPKFYSTFFALSSSSTSICCRPLPLVLKRHIAMQSGKIYPKPRRQASMQVAMKQAMAKGLEQDFGVLPTFIMPTGDNLPSWRNDRKLRWTYEKLRLKQWLMRPISKIIFRYYAKQWLPKQPVREIGEALHRSMYTAYAAGDITTLHELCQSSLANNFVERIFSRSKSYTYVWTLHRYTGKITVTDDRVAQLPVGQTMFLRQIVVRIPSVQSLGSYKGDLKIKGTGSEKETLEYLVLQQVVYTDGRKAPWHIASTVDETRVSDLPKFRVFTSFKDPASSKNGNSNLIKET